MRSRNRSASPPSPDCNAVTDSVLHGAPTVTTLLTCGWLAAARMAAAAASPYATTTTGAVRPASTAVRAAAWPATPSWSLRPAAAAATVGTWTYHDPVTVAPRDAGVATVASMALSAGALVSQSEVVPTWTTVSRGSATPSKTRSPRRPQATNSAYANPSRTRLGTSLGIVVAGATTPSVPVQRVITVASPSARCGRPTSRSSRSGMAP